MLVDEKKVEWDAPVTTLSAVVPAQGSGGDARADGPRSSDAPRRPRQRATTCGSGRRNSTEEILRRVRLIDPAYSLRSGFIYQNIMYAAAGAVVEAASGKPWARRSAQTRSSSRSGMRETVPTAATLSSHSNVASPHFLIDGRCA